MIFSFITESQVFSAGRNGNVCRQTFRMDTYWNTAYAVQLFIVRLH